MLYELKLSSSTNLFTFSIPIEFTTDPSSPKVQATIVGTLAKTNQPINQQPAETFKYQQKIPISRTPSGGVTPTFLTLPTQVQSPLTPMSIFSTGSMVKQVQITLLQSVWKYLIEIRNNFI